MRVAQVWRYPVKSMQGEMLDGLDVDTELIPGDRAWGVRDSTTGTVLTARTARPLLQATARLHGGGAGVCITLPDGRQLHDGDEQTDLALSAFLGTPVGLARADGEEQAVFEAPIELGDDTSPVARWKSRPGSFNDGHPVHVLTTASLRAAAALYPAGVWDVRRFRPNLLVDVDDDGFVEEQWDGVRVGDVELEIYKPATRCAMTARAQGDLLDDLEVPRTLARNRKAKLGVYARVTVPGTIAAGAGVHPT